MYCKLKLHETFGRLHVLYKTRELCAKDFVTFQRNAELSLGMYKTETNFLLFIASLFINGRERTCSRSV